MRRLAAPGGRAAEQHHAHQADLGLLQQVPGESRGMAGRAERSLQPGVLEADRRQGCDRCDTPRLRDVPHLQCPDRLQPGRRQGSLSGGRGRVRRHRGAIHVPRRPLRGHPAVLEVISGSKQGGRSRAHPVELTLIYYYCSSLNIHLYAI